MHSDDWPDGTMIRFNYKLYTVCGHDTLHPFNQLLASPLQMQHHDGALKCMVHFCIWFLYYICVRSVIHGKTAHTCTCSHVIFSSFVVALFVFVVFVFGPCFVGWYLVSFLV